jgi:hypothetical protein
MHERWFLRTMSWEEVVKRWPNIDLCEKVNQSIGQRLRVRPYEGGLVPPPGVNEADLDAFESRHGVKLPADMRSYFRILNGTGSTYADGDDFLLCFWALEKLEPVIQRTGDGARWFVFADHSISVIDYAIRLTADGTGSNPIVAVQHKQQVAGSFTEFVELYLADPWANLL